MSIVNFTSGINKIEESKSLSEWAVEYISQEKLNRENHGSSESFRNLPRRQKDAVRYQLRKNQATTVIAVRKKTTVPAYSKAGRVKLTLGFTLKLSFSLWISCFLLIDLVSIYVSKGFSLPLAWQTAILVEICFIAASLSKEKRIQKLAYAFFVYNMALFAFHEAGTFCKMVEANKLSEIDIQEKTQLKSRILQTMDSSTKIRNQNYNRFSALMNKGYISSSMYALSKLNEIDRRNDKTSLVKISDLEQEIGTLTKERKNVFSTGITVILYFILRGVFQLFSIWILKEKQ